VLVLADGAGEPLADLVERRLPGVTDLDVVTERAELFIEPLLKGCRDLAGPLELDEERTAARYPHAAVRPAPVVHDVELERRHRTAAHEALLDVPF